MTSYREKLWPAVWIFVAIALVIPASLLVFLPINTGVGIVTAAILYLGLAGAMIVSAPVIRVTESQLIAGNARLPLDAIGEMSIHRGDDATMERGQRLDARAWLLIRGWVSPVVRIVVADPQDPTPYWLLSTRRPAELVEAIETARSQSE